MGLAKKLAGMEAVKEPELEQSQNDDPKTDSPKEDTTMAQAAKKTTTRKTTQRRKAPVKKATTAKRTTAKKTPVKKAPATKRKTAPKKEAVKKTPRSSVSKDDCAEGFPIRFRATRKAIAEFKECETKHPTPVKHGKTKTKDILDRAGSRVVLTCMEDIGQLLNALTNGQFGMSEDPGKQPFARSADKMIEELFAVASPQLKKQYK